MDFCDLQGRLIGHLRELLRGGETTERRIATLAGISQPHIHNLLKGVRELTPAIADRLLHSLQLDLLDLILAEELARTAERRPRPAGAFREIPVLSGRIGPGWNWTAEPGPYERFSVPVEEVAGMRVPVAARLAADAVMQGVFEGGELVLVDLKPVEDAARPESLYVVERGGEAVVRWVRMGRTRGYLLTAEALDNPLAWERVTLRGHGSTVSIRGRLSFPRVCSGSRPAAVRRWPGTVPGPVPRSVAS